MSNNLQTTDLERMSQLVDSLNKAKKDKSEQQVILNKIMDFFRENNLKSYKYGDLVIRFTEERESNQFDVDELRAKYPEIWTECHTVKIREARINVSKVKTKKKDEEDDLPTDEELAE